jgi:hypothetical protein
LSTGGAADPAAIITERAPGCGILGAEQPFTREVPMDDPNDPYSPENLSWNWHGFAPNWRPFSGRWMRGPRVPPPPGPRRRPRPSKAEREQEERAEARAERLHLAVLTRAGVIIMSVVLAAVVVMLVLLLVTRH